jgi:hypothetical protein
MNAILDDLLPDAVCELLHARQQRERRRAAARSLEPCGCCGVPLRPSQARVCSYCLDRRCPSCQPDLLSSCPRCRRARR